jgi:hypothetical protein
MEEHGKKAGGGLRGSKQSDPGFEQQEIERRMDVGADGGQKFRERQRGRLQAPNIIGSDGCAQV